jgi:hypothetical protein
MVPVPVSFYDAIHPELATEVQQALMLVGSVYEHRRAVSARADDPDVIIQRADYDPMHLYSAVSIKAGILVFHLTNWSS